MKRKTAKEILSNVGSEIYMRKASAYLNFTGDVIKTDFYTMTEACARHEDVLIGIQRRKLSAGRKLKHEYDEPVLNPPKWEEDGSGQKKLVEYELRPDDLLVIVSSH